MFPETAYFNRCVVHRLKTVLTTSSAQLVNTTSHGLDALERALYRATEGLSTEEGTTTVNYPLLS